MAKYCKLQRRMPGIGGGVESRMLLRNEVSCGQKGMLKQPRPRVYEAKIKGDLIFMFGVVLYLILLICVNIYAGHVLYACI